MTERINLGGVPLLLSEDGGDFFVEIDDDADPTVSSQEAVVQAVADVNTFAADRRPAREALLSFGRARLVMPSPCAMMSRAITIL